MSNAPTVQVLVGFPVSTNYSGYFVLDSSTLNGSAVLAGAVQMVDVTSYIQGTIRADRGRVRETDQFPASSATFTLRNDDRRFDPTNASGPYAPGILPRAPVQIYVADQQIWGGYVDDYQLNYEMGQGDSGRGRSTVTVSCVDAFSILANCFINQTFTAKLSGARLTDVLTCNDVNFGSGYTFSTGTMYMQAGTFSQISALDHMQTVAASEGGWLYTDRTGVILFQDHNVWALSAAAFPNGSFTFTDNLNGTGDPISYNGSAMGYTDVGLLSATTLLYNRIQGTRTGGTQQEADDTTSQTQYLIRTLALPALELDTDTNVLGLCQFDLARFKDAEVRFDSVTAEMNGPQVTVRQQRDLAGLDIASVVMCERTPPGGAGAKITKLSMVESMKWELDHSAQSFRVTVGVTDLTTVVGLILNSSTYGLLNTDLLGLGPIENQVAGQAGTPYTFVYRAHPIRG